MEGLPGFRSFPSFGSIGTSSAAAALRVGTCAAFVVMFALLGWRCFEFLHTGIAAIGWPYELDYAEGIVWQQARLMFTPQAYGPIDRLPAIVFHYTPLYHVVSRVVAGALGTDLLATGRAVSLGSTMLIAVVIGLLVVRAAPAETGRRERLLMAAAGGLCVFSLYPVLLCGALMRVDMLAILLSVTGFWLGLKALERPGLIHFAAAFFVAALYTKQTMIAAPAALFGLLLWLRPRLALKGLATAIVIGLAVLGFLVRATDGRFLRHIFLYNMNRITLRPLIGIVGIAGIQAPLFGIALIMSLRRWGDIGTRRAEREGGKASLTVADISWMAILCYFVTTSLMLVTLIKSGSYLNYFIEWLLVVVMLEGCAFADAAHVAIGRVPMPPVSFRLVLSALFIPCAVAAQAAAMTIPDAARPGSVDRRHELDALAARVRAAPKPVISDEMVLLQRAGKRVIIEPMIFADLASTGVWDERPFVGRIRAGAYAMILTDQPHDTSRYTPAMWGAIDRAYPVRVQQAGYTLHLPAPDQP